MSSKPNDSANINENGISSSQSTSTLDSVEPRVSTTPIEQPNYPINPVNPVDSASQNSSSLNNQSNQYNQNHHHIPQAQPLTPEQEQQLINANHITYLLYLIAPFSMGIFALFALILNYIKRNDANYSWLATHFDWQIKTFWYSILLSFMCIMIMVFSVGGSVVALFAQSQTLGIGAILTILLTGFVWFCTFLWYLYRVIRGWIALTDKRAIPFDLRSMGRTR